MESLNQVWRDISANIQVLVIAGACGVLVKSVLVGSKSWRERLGQGVAGAAAAIFMGPLLAEVLVQFVEKEVYAWLAAGFLCGYGGEGVVALVQMKLGFGKRGEK